jgi:ribulose-phosphate 3-epimerase
MSKKVIIEPSLLSFDFGCLAHEAKRIEQAGADAIHIDIMDGLFVKNLTLGPKAVAAVNKATDLFLDVHLMIYSPFDYVERFIEAGADRITFHYEATEDVEDTLEYIRRCNVEAGLAFSPDSSTELMGRYLDKCDLMLIMTVQPGFGGQEFMPEMLEKVKFLRAACLARKIGKGGVVNADTYQKDPFLIQVDGGINEETGKLCAEAGANVFVSGNHLYKQKDLAHAISHLRKACGGDA